MYPPTQVKREAPAIAPFVPLQPLQLFFPDFYPSLEFLYSLPETGAHLAKGRPLSFSRASAGLCVSVPLVVELAVFLFSVLRLESAFLLFSVALSESWNILLRTSPFVLWLVWVTGKVASGRVCLLTLRRSSWSQGWAAPDLTFLMS